MDSPSESFAPISPESKSHTLGWVITYADVATLLLSFFIVTLTFIREVEKNIYREIDKLLLNAFNELNATISKNKLESVIQIDRETKGVHITIASGALFNVAEAEIKSDIIPTLESMAFAISNSSTLFSHQTNLPLLEAMKRMKKKRELEIRVEGHTDNLPIHTATFPSNWELSSARALSVVKFLQSKTGLPEKIFTASGYSEFRPLYPNTTTENQSKNRRVEIYIDAELTPEENSVSQPL